MYRRQTENQLKDKFNEKTPVQAASHDCMYEGCTEFSHESHQKTEMTSLGKFWQNHLSQVHIPTS